MLSSAVCRFLLLSACCFVLLVRCQDSDEIPVHDVIPADETETEPPDVRMTESDEWMGHPSEFPSGLTSTSTTTLPPVSTRATTTTTTTTPSTTTATPSTTRATTTTTTTTTPMPPASLQRATAFQKEDEITKSVLESQLRSRDEEINRLKETIDETNKRLILLLSEKDKLSESLNRARVDIDDVRAQVTQELSVIHRSMTNSSDVSESSWQLLRREMDDNIESLRRASESKIEETRTQSDHQILINNRIIVISLAVVSVPISFLLILILYLTLRRDKKIVKSEQRLALNEMNHLRRYNDY